MCVCVCVCLCVRGCPERHQNEVCREGFSKIFSADPSPRIPVPCRDPRGVLDESSKVGVGWGGGGRGKDSQNQNVSLSFKHSCRQGIGFWGTHGQSFLPCPFKTLQDDVWAILLGDLQCRENTGEGRSHKQALGLGFRV